MPIKLHKAVHRLLTSYQDTGASAEIAHSSPLVKELQGLSSHPDAVWHGTAQPGLSS